MYRKTQILKLAWARVFVPSSFVLNFMLVTCGSNALAENIKEPGISCSVLYQGVENGTVKTEFYDSVCSFESKADKIRNALSLGRNENMIEIEPNEENAAYVANGLLDPSVAKKFFSKLSNKSALEWFRKILEMGLNPNLVISDGVESASMLGYALQNGNIEAAIILLESGASPHIYRDPIWGEEYYEFDFLFPLDRVSAIPGSRDEKTRLIRAMFDSGLFVLTGNSGEKYLNKEEKRVENNKKIISLAQLNKDINFPLNEKVICANATKYSRYDWCEEKEKIPKYIAYDSPGSFDKQFEVFQLISLIGIYNDTMYFMILGPSWYSEGNAGLAKVSRGGDRIIFYRYTRPLAGMGHCSRLRARARGLEPGDFIDADRNADCWRRIILNRSIAEEYYLGPYDTKFYGKPK